MDEKEKLTVRTIGIALGFTLSDWQIEYMFGRSEYRPIARGTGRTTAYILRLCLSKGEPIILDSLRKVRVIEDEHRSWAYTEVFKGELRKVYQRLASFGVKLRIIFFDSDSARDYLRMREIVLLCSTKEEQPDYSDLVRLPCEDLPIEKALRYFTDIMNSLRAEGFKEFTQACRIALLLKGRGLQSCGSEEINHENGYSV